MGKKKKSFRIFNQIVENCAQVNMVRSNHLKIFLGAVVLFASEVTSEQMSWKLETPDQNSDNITDRMVLASNNINVKKCSAYVKYSVDINEFTFNPDPLVLKEGKTFKIKLDMDVENSLPGDAKVEVVMKKKIFWFVHKQLDCYSMGTYRIGTCTYTVDELMRHVKKDEESCQAFLPPEQNCTTPLMAGKYSGEIEMHVPKIPKSIRDSVVGKFFINIKLKTRSGSVFSCMDG